MSIVSATSYFILFTSNGDFQESQGRRSFPQPPSLLLQIFSLTLRWIKLPAKFLRPELFIGKFSIHGFTNSFFLGQSKCKRVLSADLDWNAPCAVPSVDLVIGSDVLYAPVVANHSTPYQKYKSKPDTTTSLEFFS